MTDPTGFALADLLLGLGAAQEIESGGSVHEMPDLRLQPGGFQEDRPARLRAVLRDVCRRTRVAAQGHAQGDRARGQGAARARAHAWNANSELKELQRESAQGRRRRELRIGGGDSRPDPDIRSRAADLTMAIHNILTNSGEWLRGEGPHHQIVISSRVRLARNLRNFAFPGWAKKAERLQILETIKPRSRSAAGDGRRLLRLFAGPLRAREAGARRAPPHLARARRERRRLRRGDEQEANALDHDQRGGSPAHAGASAAGCSSRAFSR